MTENGRKIRDTAIATARTGTPVFTGAACYLLWEVLVKLDKVLDTLHALQLQLARMGGAG
ncbi:MAG: hypothetical protein L0099_08475 [Acidobacteria bacterium]|nr:hypothetical protein [Acidobacteriota bacterium]